jgi:dTDP-4-dehydrorhamnose 3,5-epimerase
MGAIYDVIIDLRADSPTFRKWIGFMLKAENREMAYIPLRCGHDFLTLKDESEAFHQMSEFYHPEAACGVRWNDPAFQIEWPGKIEVISERDRTYREFAPK